jgi:hypothetical protein
MILLPQKNSLKTPDLYLNVILLLWVEKSSPLQGEIGGVFEKYLKPPLPLLAKEGIKPVTEGLHLNTYSQENK